MRRALLLVLLLAACTKHEPGETGTIQLALAGPADGQPFADVDAVELRLVDPGRNDPFVQAVPWPPAGESQLELLLSPEGQGWSLVVAAMKNGAVTAVGRSGPFDVAPGQPAVTVPVYVGPVNSFAAGAPTLTGASTLSGARWGHTALALPDGRLVVVGGVAADADPQNPTPASPAIELLDPLGREAAVTLQGFGNSAQVSPRILAGVALTGDGKVVITGGLGAGGALADLFVAGPGGTDGRGVPLEMAARAGAAVAMIGGGDYQGRVLVAGGCPSLDMIGCVADAWAVALDGSGDVVGGFDVVRFGATATPLRGHGDVLVAGGRDEVGLARAAYLFDATSRTMRPVVPLLTPRERHVAVPLPDGSVLLAGGLDAGGQPLASAEVFVPWLPPAGRMLAAGSLPAARAEAAGVVLADGSVMFVGGIGADGLPLASVDRFVPDRADEESETYLGAFSTPTVALPSARSGAAAALGPGGEVLLAGGRAEAGALGDVLVFAQCLPDEGLTCPAL